MIDQPEEYGKLRTIEGVYDTIITEQWKVSRDWRPSNSNHLLAAIPGTVLSFFHPRFGSRLRLRFSHHELTRRRSVGDGVAIL
ncbi:MAG: hypothetical protein ACI8Z5_002467 [Lentimonas sp.]|jgi:hypothetical protein